MITISQAAKAWGISSQAITKRIRSGVIPASMYERKDGLPGRHGYMLYISHEALRYFPRAAKKLDPPKARTPKRMREKNFQSPSNQ